MFMQDTTDIPFNEEPITDVKSYCKHHFGFSWNLALKYAEMEYPNRFWAVDEFLVSDIHDYWKK